jgi:hypothetical protein
MAKDIQTILSVMISLREKYHSTRASKRSNPVNSRNCNYQRELRSQRVETVGFELRPHRRLCRGKAASAVAFSSPFHRREFGSGSSAIGR